MESLEQQLLKNAYLFEDPRSYQAGVRDTLEMFERATEERWAEMPAEPEEAPAPR